MKSPIFKIFKKASLTLFPYGVVIWYKFQLIWTKKYLKMSILSVFYKRFYQNCKLQNAITSEHELILKFCKKFLIPLKEIFQISPTCFFGPNPPIALILAILRPVLLPLFLKFALVRPKVLFNSSPYLERPYR